ncbi:hypothetical protein [Streptomyces sp. MMG1121]|uniref:hypothetical protein n=1 Tax=Streptomyces sp. MMG1121 TaxID=1415544 RepID=UPI0006AEA7EF|nr:hypothetical protein [Streptomyces sp. MMG1121]KOV64992.1 hypothetical protein ADK64_15880 [Streptomyces sp. MMG1121]
MFSRKKIAAVSGLVGGLAVTCIGVAPAHAAASPGTCTRDILGNLSCTQRIKGEVPEGGTLPHQETCHPVEPTRLPAFLGQGVERLGPEVTCSPTTVGVPAPDKDDEQMSPDMPR